MCRSQRWPGVFWRPEVWNAFDGDHLQWPSLMCTRYIASNSEDDVALAHLHIELIAQDQRYIRTSELVSVRFPDPAWPQREQGVVLRANLINDMHFSYDGALLDLLYPTSVFLLLSDFGCLRRVGDMHGDAAGSYVAKRTKEQEDDNAWHLCGLTFELTPTAEAGRLARVVQHKPVRHTGKLARRSGSVPSEGLGSTLRCSREKRTEKA